MSDNRRTALDQDIRLEDFAAELTSAAYPFVLQRGLKDSWIKVELGLWKALAETVKNCARHRQPVACSDGFEAWREALLRALTGSALSIAPNDGNTGPRPDVESGLDQAFRQLIENCTYVS